MKKQLFGFLAALILLITPLLAFPAAAGAAAPDIPRGFYGTVKINNSPAPVGTIIEARGENVRTGIAGNPLTTTEKGFYGDSSAFGEKLIVQAADEPIAAGTEISFYVNGTKAGQSFIWPDSSTESLKNELNLTITKSSGGGSGGSGGSGSTTTTTTPTPAATTTPSASIPVGMKVFDLADYANSDGRFLRDFNGQSSDGGAVIHIPAGTRATTREGDPLTQITLQKVNNPDTAPSATFRAAGPCYDFQPEGTQFNPAVSITLAYDPAMVPAGETPYIAWWNGQTRQWEKLETIRIDTVNHTVTAGLTHFTIFAVLCRLPQGTSVPLTSTATATQTVTATAAATPAAVTSTPAQSELAKSESTGGSNSGLIIGLVIACAVLIVVVVFLLLRRRAKK